MFMSIKKRTLIYAFAALLAVSAAVIAGAVKEAGDDIDAVLTEGEAGMSGKVILVDPGHGGFDGGASANGITEKDINLGVARKLKECIEEKGGKAVMTREEDISTADENRKDGSSAKSSDLKRRRAMVQESGANMFISIHMNKFPQTEYWGAQVFYAANSEESSRLGEVLQTTIAQTLNDGNTRAAKKSDGSIFILKNASVPSAIVECGFLSNTQEAEKLKTEEYQSSLAQAICAGIEKYFEQ